MHGADPGHAKTHDACEAQEQPEPGVHTAARGEEVCQLARKVEHGQEQHNGVDIVVIGEAHRVPLHHVQGLFDEDAVERDEETRHHSVRHAPDGQGSCKCNERNAACGLPTSDLKSSLACHTANIWPRLHHTHTHTHTHTRVHTFEVLLVDPQHEPAGDAEATEHDPQRDLLVQDEDGEYHSEDQRHRARHLCGQEELITCGKQQVQVIPRKFFRSWRRHNVTRVVLLLALELFSRSYSCKRTRAHAYLKEGDADVFEAEIVEREHADERDGEWNHVLHTRHVIGQ